MRVAIIGASGQLGRQLVKEFPDAWTPSHAEFDVCTPSPEMTKMVSECDLVINCSAMHDLQACEKDPRMAFLVNSLGVFMLASVSRKLIHISTNYVFDGHSKYGYYPDDIPNPISVYGMSKYAGEMAVLAMNNTGTKHLVVRTAGLYGPGGPSGKGANFVDNVRAHKYRRIKDYEFSNQTSCVDLAKAIKRHHDREGVIHLVNEPAMSWYAFARLIWDDVEPVGDEDDDGLRPHNGELLSDFDTGMLSAEKALSEYLRGLN